MTFLSWKDKYWSSERLRELEFVGQSARKEVIQKNKSSTNEYKHPAKYVAESGPRWMP